MRFVYKTGKTVLCVIGLLICTSFAPKTDLQVRSLLADIQQHIRATGSASFRIKNTERVDGKLLNGEQYVFWNKQPLLYKIDMISPAKGATLEYDALKNNRLAFYVPNGFPYVGFYLDPYGDLMRKNNHHVLFDLGFEQIDRILTACLKNNLIEIEHAGGFKRGAEYLEKIVLRNPDFRFESYTMPGNETVRGLAQRHTLNAYMICEFNHLKNDMATLAPGTRIKIPNSYASVVELFISKSSNMPALIKIYDQYGLFEEYGFYEVLRNVTIPN